jgi:hypothetical protein
LKDKPRVDYNVVKLARPREDEDVAFMTIAKESEEPKEVFASAALKDPDTMHYHKAMREPDREQFNEVMKKKVEAHTKNQVWELIKKSTVPKGHKIMPSVWSMKRKRKMAKQRDLQMDSKAGRVRNQHLIKRLKKVGFMASQIDECLFYKDQSVFVLYTENSILA